MQRAKRLLSTDNSSQAFLCNRDLHNVLHVITCYSKYLTTEWKICLCKTEYTKREIYVSLYCHLLKCGRLSLHFWNVSFHITHN